VKADLSDQSERLVETYGSEGRVAAAKRLVPRSDR
jgi:hypothetical protein